MLTSTQLPTSCHFLQLSSIEMGLASVERQGDAMFELKLRDEVSRWEFMHYLSWRKALVKVLKLRECMTDQQVVMRSQPVIMA